MIQSADGVEGGPNGLLVADVEPDLLEGASSGWSATGAERRLATVTLAPAAWAAWATPRPIPVLPPITTTRFPVRS